MRFVSAAGGANEETVGGNSGRQSSQRASAVSADLRAGGLAKAAVNAAIPRALNTSEARMETVISAKFRRVWLAKGKRAATGMLTCSHLGPSIPRRRKGFELLS
jgi:hypothetical protein